MNNDNEKDLQSVNPDIESEEHAEEMTDAYDEACKEYTEEPQHACCDCSNCLGCSSSDFNEEAVPKKKRKIVTPVIVAAAAFAIVAAVVFGGVWIYSAFFGANLKGVWAEQGYENSGIYFEFDGNGNVYLKGGGISYFGNYEIATYDVAKDTELPNVITSISAVEPLSGKVNVLKSDFYMFGMSGGEFVYTMDNENGEKVLKFKFVDASGTVSQWAFVKTDLPKFTMDPNVITNASADEAGITTLQIDKNILGTWSEADYGTYTFYDDGTANYKTKYQVNPTYQMFYGVTTGYGIDMNFKYTVSDGKIYMSVDYYTGETNGDVLTYFLDGSNLVINGVGYTKTEDAELK
ncbi:MAG: hypothetical protein IJ451_03860 [Ruminococcus sp.]|nr:hypothetical protein [Ruminococcus sp.]